jgi:hypothetical protein
MLTTLTDGQRLTAIWRWHAESLKTHNPEKCAMIKRIILALEGR